VQERLVIPGKSDDARAKRSRDELAWALIGLMHEKSYDDIGVQEICERAGVGRSTFYTHFQDKDEMFVRHIVLFGEWMGARLNWDDTTQCYRFELEFLLEHVREMRPVYDSLARSRKADLILKVWHNKFAEGFERRIVETRTGEVQAVPAALLAQHIAGTVMNLLTWWFDHGYPLAAREMNENFQRLIAGLR
jgi:AcrR family transcriptional regulator